MLFRRSFRRRTRSPLRNDVVPANDGSQQLLQPPHPSESTTSLRPPNPERSAAHDGPRCRRFVAHWQHAADPIYCALPRPLASSHFPPPTLSTIVSSLRLEPFTLSFFRLVYIDSCAISSVFIFLLLFVAFSNSNFVIPFISLYFYSCIFRFLPFSLFFIRSSILLLSSFSYSSLFLFFSYSLQDFVFSFPSYPYHSSYFYFFYSYLVLLFPTPRLFTTHVDLLLFSPTKICLLPFVLRACDACS